jgi:SP family sugar:H+ symporter-like MFS transporter
MQLSAALFLVSSLASGGAGSSTMFELARFIGGLGVGAASVLSPAYISEVAPAAIRGRLTTLQQVMIIIGLTAAFLANYVLAGVAGSSTEALWSGHAAWRWMFWLQVIPAGIYFLALLFIPESPRYLMVKGRVEQARDVLARLLGSTVAADVRVAQIRTSLAGERQPRLADLKDPATGGWRRIVWAGIGLAVFQQLVGINVVFYYGSVLWQSVGFSEADALKQNVLTGTLSIIACLITLAVVDRIGRKPLLAFGSAGMAITLAIMVACFAQGTLVEGSLQLPKGLGTVALVSAVAYSFIFNMTWGPVMWVMLGEMFPNRIRGSGLAVAGFAQWGANFLISVSFPWLAANIGLTITYGFYAAAAAVSFFFVRALVNETTGRELEEMPG